MTEFYSEQEVRELSKPRLLAAAAASLAWLSLMATALSTWMLLTVVPATMAHKERMAQALGQELPKCTQILMSLLKLLERTPHLAWGVILPPVAALALAYLWRSRLCSLLGIVLSMALIASPLVLLFLSAA